MNESLPSPAAITAWARLVRAHTRLMDTIEHELKAASLPPLTWYDVLLELHRAGDCGLRQFEIADHVLLSKYNLSRLLDRLEREGLVQRQACPEDGRGNVVEITPRGVDMLRRIWPVYGAAIRASVQARLTAEELETLGRLLARLGGDTATPAGA